MRWLSRFLVQCAFGVSSLASMRNQGETLLFGRNPKVSPSSRMSSVLVMLGLQTTQKPSCLEWSTIQQETCARWTFRSCIIVAHFQKHVFDVSKTTNIQPRYCNSALSSMKCVYSILTLYNTCAELCVYIRVFDVSGIRQASHATDGIEPPPQPHRFSKLVVYNSVNLAFSQTGYLGL